MGESRSDHGPEHMLITLSSPIPTAIIDGIKENHPQIKVTFHQTRGGADVPKALYHDATILVTTFTLPNPEDCPKLGLIHFTSAGTNHISNTPIYTSTSIPLTTSSGIHGPQISEWVILTYLVHSHNYDLLHTWQTHHHWGKEEDGPELETVRDNVHQRLGVLGYGSIGRQVARVAHAMGMDVIAYTATPRSTPSSKKDTGFIVGGTGDPDGTIPSKWYSGLDKESLHHFLSQDIDHLLVSVPLTPQTKDFLAAPEFEILGKRNAFVSNISRGQIIHQADLIAALEQGAKNDHQDGGGGLRGAALDVADPEPLPKDDPLWDAPNCIITPHISGHGTTYTERAFQVLDVNLRRREQGGQLINVVDRKRGY